MLRVVSNVGRQMREAQYLQTWSHAHVVSTARVDGTESDGRPDAALQPLAIDRWAGELIALQEQGWRSRALHSGTVTTHPHTHTQYKHVPETQTTCQHRFQLLYITFMWKVKQKQMVELERGHTVSRGWSEWNSCGALGDFPKWFQYFLCVCDLHNRFIILRKAWLFPLLLTVVSATDGATETLVLCGLNKDRVQSWAWEELESLYLETEQGSCLPLFQILTTQAAIFHIWSRSSLNIFQNKCHILEPSSSCVGLRCSITPWSLALRMTAAV